MIAAEELGLEADQVRPHVADTDSIGHTDGTGGSRVALATGMAVHEAARDAKRQLLEHAARSWRTSVDEVHLDADGVTEDLQRGAAPAALLGREGQGGEGEAGENHP